MTCEAIDIIWLYLILFLLLLELVILNLNVKKGHMEFGGNFGAVLHCVCNIPKQSLLVNFYYNKC